jgi:transcriptional regulator with XRE-family HTH domain
MGDLRITDGARQLRQYLQAHGLTIPTFCEAHALDRIQVARIMKGERHRISVDFALSVFEATGGTIDWRTWASSTLRTSDPVLAATGTGRS